MQAHFRSRYPKTAEDSDHVYRSAIRAKALDTLRGLLPAAVAIQCRPLRYGPGLRSVALRMRAHPLAEVQAYGDMMLHELRKVIPAFLTRVDQPDRGGRWSEYLAETRSATAAVARTLLHDIDIDSRPEVVLTDFDADGGDQDRRRGVVRSFGFARRSSSGNRAGSFPGRSNRDPARVHRLTRQSAPQAGPCIRTIVLPLRHSQRLRRFPRSAAASAADAGMATAQHPSRLHRARRHGGSRRARRLASRDGRRGWTLGSTARGRSGQRCAICRADGLPRFVSTCK